jgi:hypothetical protein
MSKDDGLVRPGPCDDFGVQGFGWPNRTPMNDLMTSPMETAFPRRG